MKKTRLRASACPRGTTAGVRVSQILGRVGRRGVRRGPRWILVLAGTLFASVLSGSCSQPRRALEAPATTSTERLVVDTRDPEEFAAGHLPGAVNLQWGWGQLRIRVSSYVPDPETPLALVAADEEQLALAAGLLEQHGYLDVTRPAETEATARLATWTAADLAAALAGPAPPRVVDVRTSFEQALGAIPGALRVDPDEAAALVLDPTGPFRTGLDYAVICERGVRSSQLASWMQRNGLRARNVLDGMAGWRALPAAERDGLSSPSQ